MKDGQKVVSPNSGRHGNLTVGKSYTAELVETYDTNSISFYIVDDSGEPLFCLLNHCSNINHKNWAILPN